MTQHQQANFIAGAGIEGDRYCDKTGFWSFRRGAYRHVTLVTEEELAHYNSIQTLATFTPENIRRNLVIANLELSSLLGQYLTIGGVELYVVRLINFCPRMNDMFGSAELTRMFNNNGWKLGAHCEVIESGTVSVDDIVTVKPFVYPKLLDF